MLMSPNKDETAVHGCHCSGDMVMRMRKILAIPRFFVVCAPYFYFSKTIPFEVAHTYLAYHEKELPPPRLSKPNSKMALMQSVESHK